MRTPLPLWPRRAEWTPGLLVSVPMALLLFALRGADEETRAAIAAVAVLLALPWVVPGLVLIAALSAPVYMWLHTKGPVPSVLEWLGITVLVAAVIGAHINAALAWLWLHRRKTVPEPGIGDFLKRPGSSGAERKTDDAS
jgi:hypothetical protein